MGADLKNACNVFCPEEKHRGSLWLYQHRERISLIRIYAVCNTSIMVLKHQYTMPLTTMG